MYPKAYIDYLVEFHATRDYFECHEILEEFWKEDPPKKRKRYWVGFIQLAVALYHHRRQNTAGAKRLMANSIRILQAEHRAVEDLGLIMAVCSNLCNRFTHKSKWALPIKALCCQSKMRNWRKHAGSNARKKSIHGGSPVHSATYFLSTNTVCGIGLTSSVNVKKK